MNFKYSNIMHLISSLKEMRLLLIFQSRVEDEMLIWIWHHHTERGVSFLFYLVNIDLINMLVFLKLKRVCS